VSHWPVPMVVFNDEAADAISTNQEALSALWGGNPTREVRLRGLYQVELRANATFGQNPCCFGVTLQRSTDAGQTWAAAEVGQLPFATTVESGVKSQAVALSFYRQKLTDGPELLRLAWGVLQGAVTLKAAPAGRVSRVVRVTRFPF
jgi:hypothetical protein